MAARNSAQAARTCLRQLKLEQKHTSCWSRLKSCRGFSTSRATKAIAAAAPQQLEVDFVPSTKPPSARPVEPRKSQMIRTYTSLLRTTPLMLFFQHSSITALEWDAIRRELKKAMAAVPPIANSVAGSSQPIDISPQVLLQVLRTNMFSAALKIIEFHDPKAAAEKSTTPHTIHGPLVHDLSQVAYDTVKNTEIPPNSAYAQLAPLMVGPVAALTMPAVSPAHLAAALSILSPVPGKFPAPTRRKNPGYWDPYCQDGLSKLLLIGGRIEGRIFDQSSVGWVGSITGGMEGLRAQLVGILQGAGLSVTTALEGGSKSLWLALEGRKSQLEEQSKEKEDKQTET
ncbi:hypothetical protein CDD82_4325 [Ophiocordyceps australis]|uniref:Ribosomal protein YmL11, mitochondrial n=1 Tax=Ophiocordyceps australis TaxID=1399860 RepID=A0A2C5Z7D4_9HYPO|nr:hypothetical protein CDD82_4325 [Ophiocordyceps australis]